MAYWFLDIDNIAYRLDNDKTKVLPKQYNNVCIELDESVNDINDFKLKNAVGMFIINTTGYTPESFTVKPSV